MEQPKYRIELFWSDEDEGYIANVPDLLYCSAFGETYEEALREVLVALELHLDTLRELGRDEPESRVITSVADERIKNVRVTDDELVVTFVDGRTLSVPLVWYPRLLNASVEQRSDWELIGDGEGVHWPKIDEALSAEGLLRGVPGPAATRQEAGEQSVDLSPTEGTSARGGRATANKKAVHVSPRGDGWAVIREGNERASSIHATQKEAERHGRETARKDKTEFFLHNRQGEIRVRSNYRQDVLTPREREVLEMIYRQDVLTPREREVLEMVAQGHDKSRIAQELHRSVSTIRRDFKSATEALRAARAVDEATLRALQDMHRSA